MGHSFVAFMVCVGLGWVNVAIGSVDMGYSFAGKIIGKLS